METTICPIDCVRAACPDPDFLEKHSTFVITMTASASGLLGVIFAYFLKSRCRKISCFGVSCERDPVQLTVAADGNLEEARQ